MQDNSKDEDNNDADDALQAHPGYLRLNEPQNKTAEGDVVDIVDGPTVQAHVELAAKSGKSLSLGHMNCLLKLPSAGLFTQCHCAYARSQPSDPPHNDPTIPS